ncbi:MAG: NADH-quinone oxidoreductase subunit C [Vampirovibrionales bacterium]
MNAENTNTPISKPNPEAVPPAPKAPTPATEAPAVPEVPALPLGVYGQALADAGLKVEALPNDATGREQVRVSACCLLKAAELLKHHPETPMDLLLSVCGLDWKTHRESVVHLHSTLTGKQVIVKTQADEHEVVPSLMPVYPAADWHERETYDLMGIRYEGHPNLKRILMPDYWLGHPLRKDYKDEDPRLVWNKR